MAATRLDDPRYVLRTRVGAFLQRDQSGSAMIEFWRGTPEEQREFLDLIKEAVSRK